MSRREFSVSVQKKAARRANGVCEGGCGLGLVNGQYNYDHDIPDGLGGEPTLENCRVLCLTCHRKKTHEQDNPRMQKADRQSRKIALNIRPPSRLQGPKFPKPAPQLSASRKSDKTMPRRGL
jgi:5-methylcytosine-specific restriction protein A